MNIMKVRNTQRNKRGQVWTVDFILGLMLFLFTIIVVIKILFSIAVPDTYEPVYRDAIYLSDKLLSTGYPQNWTTNNVVIPGIANQNRIDVSRLSKYSQIDYLESKTLMHLTSDYIFFFRNSTSIINTGQCIYGYNLSVDGNCNPLITTVKYDNIMHIDRIVIYNSTPMIMTLYVWE